MMRTASRPATRQATGTATGPGAAAVTLPAFVLGETYSEAPGDLCTIPMPVGVTAPYHPIHPSVQYFPTGKSGYKYWLGCCPYHGGGVVQENPCVYASNDGVTFVEPAGLTNPIAPTPAEGGNNADPHLYWDVTGQQFVMSWMRSAVGWQWDGSDYDTAPGYNSGEIKMMTSPDGIAWDPVIHALQDNVTLHYLSSPSLLRMPDGTWRLYIINQAPAPNTLEYYTAAALAGPWTLGEAATYSVKVTEPWHVEVRLYQGKYVMLMNTVDIYSRHELIFLTSTDGIAWSVDESYPFAQAWMGSSTSTGYYKSAFVLGPWFGEGVAGRIWTSDELWQFVKVSNLLTSPASRLSDTHLEDAIDLAIADTANSSAYKVGTRFPYDNGNLNTLTTDGKVWYGYGVNTMQVDTNALKMGAGASYACLPLGLLDGVVGMRISTFPITASFNIEVRSNRSAGLQRLQIEFVLKVWAVKVYTGSAWVVLAAWYPPLLGEDYNMDGTILTVEFRGLNTKVFQNGRKVVDVNMDQATYDSIKNYTNSCITIVDANTRIDRFFAHA